MEHLQYGRHYCEHHTPVNVSFCWLQQSYTHFTVEETKVQFLGVPKDTQLWRGRAGVWTWEGGSSSPLPCVASSDAIIWAEASWIDVDFISLS